MTLEYEGTRYRGWQEQTNARTVAGELRRALERVAGQVSNLGGSGRTDAGVHAIHQVAHVSLARAMPSDALVAAINDLLPPDIHLISAVPVSPRFNARHDALGRSYLYQICRRRTAFGKRFVWWVRAPLDIALMQEAARLVVGRHDFAAFCEKPGDQTSTLVVVERAEIVIDGALVLVRLVASHFLWRMVRRLVGTLVEDGAGRLDIGSFAGLLEGAAAAAPGEEGPAKWTAPPSGLFLERVLYSGDPPLRPLAPLFPVPGEADVTSRGAADRAPRGVSHEARRGPRGGAETGAVRGSNRGANRAGSEGARRKFETDATPGKSGAGSDAARHDRGDRRPDRGSTSPGEPGRDRRRR